MLDDYLHNLATLIGLIALSIYVILKYLAGIGVQKKLIYILEPDEKVVCEIKLLKLVEYIAIFGLYASLIYPLAYIVFPNYSNLRAWYITPHNAVFFLLLYMFLAMFITIIFGTSKTVFTNKRKITVFLYEWFKKTKLIKYPIEKLSDIKNYNQVHLFFRKGLFLEFKDGYKIFLYGIQNSNKVRKKVLELIELNKKKAEET